LLYISILSCKKNDVADRVDRKLSSDIEYDRFISYAISCLIDQKIDYFFEATFSGMYALNLYYKPTIHCKDGLESYQIII